MYALGIRFPPKEFFVGKRKEKGIFRFKKLGKGGVFTRG
jgi:hypothetical protein